MTDDQPFFAVARITAPWGIRGDLTLQVLSDNPDRFRPGGTVYLDRLPHTVERTRTIGGKTVIKLSGIEDRNGAEPLRGKFLEVPEAELMPLPPDVYFVHQLLGLHVQTTAGDSLGLIADILHTGGNDVYVVHGKREVLIPAIGDVVKEIDLAGGTVVVDPIPGLLD